MSRGDVVWDGDKPCGDAGRGEFVPCARPDPAKPRRRKTELPL
jgi:dihydropyrimidinase